MGRKAIDMTNQKIGYLTVLEQDTSKKDYIYQKCQCQCGNIKSIKGTDLRTGRVVSCGCYNKKINKQIHYVNLLNQKFGRLTVIEDTNKINKNRHKIQKCRCDCGTIIEIPSDKLNTKTTQSCGCLRSKGEEKIGQLLQEMNLNYIKEKTFPNCKNPQTNYLLRFDFYIPIKNYLIEFDGIQHFQSKEENFQLSKEKYSLNTQRDIIKNNQCLENNIPLIRIPYTHLKDLCIEDLQLETSKYIIGRNN